MKDADSPRLDVEDESSVDLRKTLMWRRGSAAATATALRLPDGGSLALSVRASPFCAIVFNLPRTAFAGAPPPSASKPTNSCSDLLGRDTRPSLATIPRGGTLVTQAEVKGDDTTRPVSYESIQNLQKLFVGSRRRTMGMRFWCAWMRRANSKSRRRECRVPQRPAYRRHTTTEIVLMKVPRWSGVSSRSRCS